MKHNHQSTNIPKNYGGEKMELKDVEQELGIIRKKYEQELEELNRYANIMPGIDPTSVMSMEDAVTWHHLDNARREMLFQ